MTFQVPGVIHFFIFLPKLKPRQSSLVCWYIVLILSHFELIAVVSVVIMSVLGTYFSTEG